LLRATGLLFSLEHPLVFEDGVESFRICCEQADVLRVSLMSIFFPLPELIMSLQSRAAVERSISDMSRLAVGDLKGFQKLVAAVTEVFFCLAECLLR
jgi:hypothetical protein